MFHQGFDAFYVVAYSFKFLLDYRYQLRLHEVLNDLSPVLYVKNPFIF